MYQEPRSGPYAQGAEKPEKCESSPDDGEENQQERETLSTPSTLPRSREPQYGGPYVVLPPDETKRKKLQQMAAKELEDLEQWKAEHRLGPINMNPVQLGGSMSEAEARQNQLIQHQQAKYKQKLRREESQRKKRDEEEAKIQKQKSIQREKNHITCSKSETLMLPTYLNDWTDEATGGGLEGCLSQYDPICWIQAMKAQNQSGKREESVDSSSGVEGENGEAVLHEGAPLSGKGLGILRDGDTALLVVNTDGDGLRGVGADANKLEEKKKQEQLQRQEQFKNEHSRQNETFFTRLMHEMPASSSYEESPYYSKPNTWDKIHSYKELQKEEENKKLQKMKEEQRLKSELLEEKQKVKEEQRLQEIQNAHRRVNSTFLDELERKTGSAMSRHQVSCESSSEGIDSNSTLICGNTLPWATEATDTSCEDDCDQEWIIMKLHSVFPYYEISALGEVLQQCNWDYNQACELLS
ncbi:epithelial-stromal interaction protein 1 [Protopterus annectens]|uniref:epithelial-stromal interaction protein 1 n=1 Tax=Protopterus annectens TaxID=7888 RepID=UPI001CFA6E12|nr:epithelial-stromal interaction protein 1 [Protopterus annectens]